MGGLICRGIRARFFTRRLLGPVPLICAREEYAKKNKRLPLAKSAVFPYNSKMKNGVKGLSALSRKILKEGF